MPPLQTWQGGKAKYNLIFGGDCLGLELTIQPDIGLTLATGMVVCSASHK